MQIDEHTDWFEDLENRLRATTRRNAHRFAVACCRRSQQLIVDPRHRNALEAAEAFANGDLLEPDFEMAMRPIMELWAEPRPKSPLDWQAWHYVTAALAHLGRAEAAAFAADFMARAVAAEVGAEREAALRSEEQALTDLSVSFGAADVIPRKSEDPFAESDEWIAAEGRQLLRAVSAYDPKAVEVCRFYLCDFLAKTLGAHLRKLPRWQIPKLWFDGLSGPEFDFLSTERLQITSWLVCVAEDGSWLEPFQFDLQLYPGSGRFRGYRFRVGDSRSRSEKSVLRLGSAHSPVGGWLEEIVRGKVSEFYRASRTP